MSGGDEKVQPEDPAKAAAEDAAREQIREQIRRLYGKDPIGQAFALAIFDGRPRDGDAPAEGKA